jgi:WhiB family redox-sensing transcriptional regulator
MAHGTSEVEYVSDLDPATARLAGIAVCHNFPDPEVARELIAMLGIDGKPMRDAPAAEVEEPPEQAEPQELAPALPTGDDWTLRGLCRDEPERWWPVSSTETADTRYAKRVCEVCPVLEQCGKTAANSGEQYGIWAGHRMDKSGERVALGDLHGVDLRRRRRTTSPPPPPKPARSNAVDCPAVLAHIAYLKGHGALVNEIAAVVGCAPSTISAFTSTQKPVSVGLAAALMAVDMSAVLAVRADNAEKAGVQ